MGITNDEITMQCHYCHKMVNTYISYIIEDESFDCPNCFENNITDVAGLLFGIEELKKKVEEHRGKRQQFSF